MKLYEVWINISERDRYNSWNDKDTSVWVGIFDSKEMADTVGKDALSKVLLNRIKLTENGIKAEFEDSDFKLCIDELELNQRYDCR